MNVDLNLVERLVQKVLEQVDDAELTTAGDCGVFATMDEAVAAAEEAQREYLTRSMADRAKYVQVIRDVVLKKENLEYMSQATVDETGMGGYEYKVIKNTLAATKTPGVEDLTTEALSGDDGLTLVEYSPFGVIGAITPTTNPTETVICNSIGMLAAGNAVVFSPHPRAKNVTLFLIKAINRALMNAGAPANLVVTVAEPSIENTNAMIGAIRNPWVDIISHPGDGTASLHFEPIVLAAKEHHTLLEINNSSLNPIRQKVAARDNNLEILRLCKRYETPVILGSDAHISFDIANYDHLHELLRLTEFPEALIMNDKIEAFKAMVDKH